VLSLRLISEKNPLMSPPAGFYLELI